jgi:hypothetical protein
MYDMLLIKSGMKHDTLSALCFNFALEYAIRRIQVNQDDLKLRRYQDRYTSATGLC